MKNDLKPYRVMLHEEPGDKFRLVFDCMAEDDDHAVEQAENAYPGCEIISYLSFENIQLSHVIYSPNESAIGDGSGFWNNKEGWVDIQQATRFSLDETERLNLPISPGGDAKWVLFDEASASYGEKKQFDVMIARSEAIKSEYLSSSCQSSDVDAAIGTLMIECGELFGNDRAAWSFLMEETHEEDDEEEEKVDALGNQCEHECIACVGCENKTSAAFCQKMEVSLDGGITFQPAPEGVRIAYKKVMIDGEDGRGELVINATHEGLITDLWVHRDEPEVSLVDYNHNIGTDCVMIDDIVSRLIEENA